MLFWVGAGAVGQNGGTLAQGASATATFDVQVAAPPSTIPPGTQITNSATASFIAGTLGAPLTAESNETTTTVAVPDLTIAKTPPSFTAVGGTPQTWDLVVTNTGTAPTAGVVTVTDTPPTNAFSAVTSAAGAGWTCGIAAGTVTCTRGDALAPGAAYPPITLTATTVATPPFGNIANTTEVAGGGDGDTTNNVGTSTGAATSRADLQVLKTADQNAVNTGNTLTYTIRVRNGGPSTAPSPSLEDALPAGIDVVSVTPSQGTCTLAASCALGDLAPGAEVEVTIVATVTSTTPGTLSNTAAVVSTVGDPEPSNNQSTADVVLAPSADLSIAKTVTPDPLESSAPGSFTLTVTNDGPQAAANTVISDRLPDGFTPTPVPAGCTFGADQILSCAIGTVASGATQTLTVNGTLAASTAGTLLTNTATVSAATADPDLLDNTSAVSTPVTPAADLLLTKFADNAAPTAGETVTFTLALLNRGPSPASEPRVTDTLPAGLSFVSGSPGCSAAGRPSRAERPRWPRAPRRRSRSSRASHRRPPVAASPTVRRRPRRTVPATRSRPTTRTPRRSLPSPRRRPRRRTSG